MDSPIQPMTLGDIFERTVTLTGKTFVRNLVVSIIFLALPAFLVTAAAGEFYGALSSTRGSFPSFWTIVPYILTTILMLLAGMFAQISISYIVGKEMLSEHVDFREALAETFSHRWLNGIGQAIIKYGAVFGGIMGIGAVFAILDSELKNVSTIMKGLLMLVQIPFFIIAVPALIFLFYRWLFSLTAVAVDDLDSMKALRKSWRLVDGYWWRTFWIFFLLSLLTEVAVTIISTPLKFGSMWGVYTNYYSALTKAGSQAGADAMTRFHGNFGYGVGIGTAISSILSLLVTPVFTVVMYFDLKARHDDLPVQETPGTISDSTSPAV